MFEPYASEIWTKSYGPNCTKFELFDIKKNKKKRSFYNNFLQSVDAILEDVSAAKIIF